MRFTFYGKRTTSYENDFVKSPRITSKSVHYQCSPDQLHAKTIAFKQGVEASSGALAINTGEFTGRSPKDRFIVKDAITKDKVWWGISTFHFRQKRLIISIPK